MVILNFKLEGYPCLIILHNPDSLQLVEDGLVGFCQKGCIGTVIENYLPKFVHFCFSPHKLILLLHFFLAEIFFDINSQLLLSKCFAFHNLVDLNK